MFVLQADSHMVPWGHVDVHAVLQWPVFGMQGWPTAARGQPAYSCPWIPQSTQNIFNSIIAHVPALSPSYCKYLRAYIVLIPLHEQDKNQALALASPHNIVHKRIALLRVKPD